MLQPKAALSTVLVVDASSRSLIASGAFAARAVDAASCIHMASAQTSATKNREFLMWLRLLHLKDVWGNTQLRSLCRS